MWADVHGRVGEEEEDAARHRQKREATRLGKLQSQSENIEFCEATHISRRVVGILVRTRDGPRTPTCVAPRHVDAPRVYIHLLISPNEQRAGEVGGGGRCQTFFFLLFFFPCSADHERGWPPCKVVFFGLATNALNVRNNNNFFYDYQYYLLVIGLYFAGLRRVRFFMFSFTCIGTPI